MNTIKQPSIKDVAKVAGVSTATVSHVINGTRFVSDDTKERVLLAMKQIGYFPNYLARSLRNQDSKTIGLLIPDISNFYYTGVAEAVERTVKTEGYHIVVGNSHDDIESEKDIVKLFNSLQICGMIIVPAIGKHAYLETTVGQYPIVFADRRPVGFDGDSVILENTKATYDAVKLLLNKNRERIALVVGNKQLSTTQDRIVGYKKAYEESGLDYDPSLIIEGKFTFESGYEIVKKLVANQKIDAIFFANDSATIGGIKALNEAKIQIPKDVAIIGCNDFAWTKIVTPPITVISQPSSELGASAAKLLLEKINVPDSSTDIKREYKHLSVPTRIILRQSC